MTAIDMNTGDHVWMTPLGNGDLIRRHRLLRHLDLPPLGGDGRGGPLLTKTLLMSALSAGGSDGGARLVAFDKATGDELGSVDLPRGAIGTPMTYMVDDKQYIAMTIGGSPPELIAFALPTSRPTVQAQSVNADSVWDGIYSNEQADRGEALFVQQCVACHSNQPGGASAAPAVIGGDFKFRWTDAPLRDLYDTIVQTMPLAAPNSLGADEYADITAYILKLNDYPAGSVDIDPRQRQSLQRIRIDEQ
jgi:mono/diheme cytochrome c family protein